MDTRKAIEDQFLKLHPCLPVDTRIGIVGAGPSGLSAAYALCMLGYNNVTVLEKHHSVAGMCESVDIEGRIYDLGGQVLAANSAPTVFHLAREMGFELDCFPLQDKAKESGRIGVHAVSDLAADSTTTFLEGRGFKGLPKSVAYGYTASGYGFPQDMPYAYIHEFTRTSMAGKIRRFKGGYTSLWQNISDSLPAKVHFMGIYVVGLLSTLSGACLYAIYIWITQSAPSVEYFSLLCISGALHWFPFTIAAYAIIISSTSLSLIQFAVSISLSYIAHGLILSFFTFSLTRILSRNEEKRQDSLREWLCHRINIACHLRFAKLLSGTEAFCAYLRLLGAKVGKHCSIRAINPISDPKLVSIGAGVHLGDFSRIVTGFYSSSGFTSGKVEVQDNSIVGSQGLVLPGSIVQNDVILGALSVAPVSSVLQSGGVYVGSQTPCHSPAQQQFKC